jgi:hypothetical protein
VPAYVSLVCRFLSIDYVWKRSSVFKSEPPFSIRRTSIMSSMVLYLCSVSSLRFEYLEYDLLVLARIVK